MHIPHFSRCLVFGTDGLWNVVTPQAAIDNVRQSDQMNERSACINECKEWINPSKNLVDKALERWSTKKMRADNTSVVIIMFDPPGPPKRDILKSSSSSKSHLLGYLPADNDDSSPSQHLEIEPVQNFAVFDHSTNELMDIDGVPLPTSGATVLTRYDNLPEDNVDHHHAFGDGTLDDGSGHGNTDDNYMNSFAESYNSLLNSSLADDDHSYVYDEVMDDSDFDDSNSYDNSNDDEPTYSLHRMQTRSEQQQYHAYASTSTAPMPSTSYGHSDYAPHNLIDHNYLRRSTTFPSGYDENADDQDEDDSDDDDDYDYDALLPMSSRGEYLPEPKTSAGPNAKTIIRNYSPIESQLTKCDATLSANDDATGNLAFDTLNDSRMDDSIQINEISSSDNNNLPSGVTSPRLRKASVQKPFVAERIATRSSQQTTIPRVTRSAGTEKRIPAMRNLKQTVGVLIGKRRPSSAIAAASGKVHKENISILKKVPVKAFVDKAIVSPGRVVRSAAGAHSPVQSDNSNQKNQRTLRSQNALTKDIQASKAIHRTASHQTADVSTFMQRITQAKRYAVSTRANSSIRAAAGENNNDTDAKSLVCKKPPKRLINNTESVQIVKSNISNKLTKPATPTLRFKVIVAKKSAMQQLKRVDTRTSVITRRMRLQQ